MKQYNVYDDWDNITSTTTHEYVTRLIKRLEAIPYEDGIKLLFNPQRKKALKQETLTEDDYVCYICGCKCDNDSATVDHVVTRNNNGPFAKYNLKTCCTDCNSDKGSLNLDEYIVHMILHRPNYPWLTDERIDTLNQLWDENQSIYTSEWIPVIDQRMNAFLAEVIK